MQRALYMDVIIQFTWAITITQTPWLPRHHVVLPLSTSHLVSSLHLAQTADSSPSSSYPAYFLCRILPLIIQLHVCLLGFFVVKLAHLILLATTPS